MLSVVLPASVYLSFEVDSFFVLFSSLFITTQHRHRSLQHFSQTEVYTSGYSNHEFEPLRTHVCMKCKCGGAAAESVPSPCPGPCSSDTVCGSVAHSTLENTAAL